MASTKEIQTRMKSIQDTMKITSAMYMISSAKMKKAKKVLADTEPYFFGLKTALGRILRHLPEEEQMGRYLDERRCRRQEERNRALIVVTADKGLNGSYNHNIIKAAEEELKKPGRTRLFVLGAVGRQYFSKKDVDVDTSFRYTVQKPTMHRARLITDRMINGFLDKEFDDVSILYTQMTGSMQEEPMVEQLLPLKRIRTGAAPLPLEMRREEIRLFPSAREVMDNLAPAYMVGLVYGALVESYASEHNARMLAMQASTDSAKAMLKDLSIQYNRARQAAITQEITEVISGANAQKKK